MTHYVFISHAWKYHETYDKIVDMLDLAPRFQWKNYSVPRHDPVIANNKAALRSELDDQIRPVRAVVILSGLYVSYSEWIQYEIDKAVEWDKYIIGVRPWAAQRIPQQVTDKADIIVGWNTSTIVDAIREASQG